MHKLVIILVFLSGCISKTEKKYTEYIPEGREGRLFKVKSLFEKSLSLPLFDDQKDKIDIKIWVYLGLSRNKTILLHLKQSNDTGFVNLKKFYYNTFDQKPDSIKILHLTTKEFVITEERIKKSIRRLLDLKIDQLPTMDSLPNNSFTFSDGDGVNIEFRSKQQYRIYSYDAPWHFTDRWWQADNVTGILRFANQEFDLLFLE